MVEARAHWSAEYGTAGSFIKVVEVGAARRSRTETSQEVVPVRFLSEPVTIVTRMVPVVMVV